MLNKLYARIYVPWIFMKNNSRGEVQRRYVDKLLKFLLFKLLLKQLSTWFCSWMSFSERIDEEQMSLFSSSYVFNVGHSISLNDDDTCRIWWLKHRKNYKNLTKMRMAIWKHS